MTKKARAAHDIQYGEEFFKEGDLLPEKLVKEFEESDPSILSTFVEVNSRWWKIDDPKIKGWVKENKSGDKRLRTYFGIKEKPVAEEEDNSNMLRSRQPEKFTKEDLESKSFKQLKVIGKKFGVTDRSKNKLIKEILAAQ